MQLCYFLPYSKIVIFIQYGEYWNNIKLFHIQLKRYIIYLWGLYVFFYVFAYVDTESIKLS